MRFNLPNDWQGELVEDPNDLPDLTGASTLFMDFETATSGVQKDDFLHRKERGCKRRGGVWPYLGDSICGIAVTADDNPRSWYVPVRHVNLKWNLPLESVSKWLDVHLRAVPRWVNHNIKFDAHFAYRETGTAYEGKLVDTLTMAKCYDSDRLNHALKALCREWCDLDMSGEEFLKSWLKSEKTKDYADAPADILGGYACEDVQGNRVLYRMLQEKMPGDLDRVCRMEVEMTTLLFDMERRGLQVNRKELKIALTKSLHNLIMMNQEINDAVGFEYTDSSKSNTEIFINQMHLPVQGYTDKGQPSFAKEAMAQYKSDPDVLADPAKEKLVTQIDQFRAEKHFKSTFLTPYLLFSDENELIHPSYNQVVRTGRMSCSEPNFMGLSPQAKELVHPRDGCAFLSFDASQVEFRLIVHYIKDEPTIKAYHENPRTDFHSWVAEQCRVKRGPGKTLNFAIGYGAGEKKVTSNLRANEDIIKEIALRVNKMIEEGRAPENLRQGIFNKNVVEHASFVYRTYHAKFPGLKVMAKRTERNCKVRGWVKTAFGRRRHLPSDYAHKGFNAVVQGCAMDYIKDRMVILFHDQRLRGWGVYMLANVHDEILFEGPVEAMRDPMVRAYILSVLQTDPIGFRVPLRWDAGYSEKTWREASKDDDAKLDTDELEALAIEHYGWDPALNPGLN